MESKKTQNRHSLACKFCLRTQETLTVHLRRACKRDADAEEIELLMQEAKAKMRSILKGLSVVKYEDLDYKDSDPLDFFVNFLEKNGCYVRGKPEKSASSPMEERIRPSNINRTKVNLNRAADKVVERQAPFKDLDLSHKKTKPVHEKEVETQGPVKVLDLSVRSHKKTKPSPVNAEKVQRHRPIAEQPDHPMESEEEDIVGPVNEKEVETRGPFKKLDIPIESEEEDIVGPVNQKEVETRGPFKKLDIPVESDKENHAGPSTDDNDDDENPKKLDQSKTESHLILLKKKMKAAGMYRKHSLECDLLVSFRTFLQQELRVRRWSQEVEEWRNRKLSDCKTRMAIAVKKHKTATQQVATVLLEEEEEQWFDVFYKKIRPSFIRSGTSPKTFFISSSGEPIHSVTNDIARLHQKFNLRPVTSQEARRRMETYMASHLKTDAERYSFAKMLGHSNLTAERVYREKTIENMVEAAEVMKKALYGPQASTSRFKQMPQQPLETESTVVSRDLRENAFERFKKARPVTHDANPPCLKAFCSFWKK